MLTRIRNAVRNRAPHVNCLNNKLNRGVAQVLIDEGYIKSLQTVDEGAQGILRLELKYGPRGERTMDTLKRVSTVGRRVYRGVADIPRPIQGLGIAIVSTSRGVMSDRRCREANIGGEVVAIVT